MSKSDSFKRAYDLAQSFRKEIARASNLDSEVFTLPRPVWIMGTVLPIGVSTLKAWEQITSNISKAMQTSEMILHASFTTGREAICLKMSTRTWAYSRQDRGRGSPILSPRNGERADSIGVPQELRLIPAYNSKWTPRWADLVLMNRYDEYQLLAHFLRLSIRLSATDLGTFLDLLVQSCRPSRTAHGKAVMAKSDNDRCMIHVVSAALAYAQRKGFLDHDHLKKMLGAHSLIEFSKHFSISAADRSFDEDSWVILVKLEGSSAMEALRRRTPSFFVHWPKASTCKPQVHVIDTPVLSHRKCLFLAFWKKPGEIEIGQILDRLHEVLKVKSEVTMLSTLPFQKSGEKERWIRPDGFLDIDLHRVYLCKHLRKAIESQRNDSADRDDEILSLEERFPTDREPQCFILWCRQGKEDGNDARSAIPRQLTTIVRSGWFSGPSPIYRPGVDVIYVVEEICSTSQHSFEDRTVSKRLPRGMPRVIITVNPNRLTCRANEIDLIVGEDDCWFTRGMVGQKLDVLKWYEVKGGLRLKLDVHVTLNQQRSIETGTYSRGDAAATMINNNLKATGEETHAQIRDLQKAIRHMIKTHGFKFLLIWVRTSPARKPTDKEGTNSSIERQVEYLTHMTDESGIERRFHKAAGVSASNHMAVTHLEKALKELKGKTLVVSTRPDRITRSASEFERLQKIIGPGGHGTMSFLWDFETQPKNVCEALRLPPSDSTHEAVTGWEDSLKKQKRAPMVRLNRPVHQPILSMFGTDTNHPNYLCGRRHAEKAQEWSRAQVTVNYQGDTDIEPELSMREEGQKGIPDGMVKAQEAFFRNKFSGPIDITFLVINGGPNAYTCSCRPRSTSNIHDLDCPCKCGSCNESRSCPCNVEKECICPPLCNCHCDYCHDQVFNPPRTKEVKEGDHECAGQGCKKIVRKIALRCTTCAYIRKVERECATPECSRFAPRGDYGGHGKYCAQCCENGAVDEDKNCRRLCMENGCQNLAPMGCKTGSRCPGCDKQHKAAVGKNKKRKRDADDVGAQSSTVGNQVDQMQ